MLYFIFLVFGIIVFILGVLKKVINDTPIDNCIIENEYKKYYKSKQFLLTSNELNFYKILLEISKELDMILFSQVSLYNIISVKENLDYKTKMKYFNKIASKSIDFVLVDKTNCEIKLCIELDDSTHKQQKRIKRDVFINNLFLELEISLLRYPVYNTYYKETLKNNILNTFKQ